MGRTGETLRVGASVTRSVSSSHVLGFTLAATRLSLGGVFLWSGLFKLRQPYAFLANVYGYELLGPKSGMLLAMVLPWLELLLSVCLLGGVFLGGTLLGAFALGAVFTMANGWALHQGLNIDCGCFGTLGQDTVGPSTLALSAVVMIAGLAGFSTLLARSTPRRDGAGAAPVAISTDGALEAT